MKNLIKEEINEIKYLFGYQRGVVISEQTDTPPIEVKSPYLKDKVETAIKDTMKINSTEELLSNLKGKTLYIYNKPTKCDTSSIKNIIDGEEATTDDTVLPFPYTIYDVGLYSEDTGIGKDTKTDSNKGKNYIYLQLKPNQENYKYKDLNIKIENKELILVWQKETGWKIDRILTDIKDAYNECLEMAINEMLPNGLATIKKEKTDLGYKPDVDYDSNVA